MLINKINLINFRIHEKFYHDFSDGINIIQGLNGTGKTSILEGIAICSLSKSFIPVQDSSLIKYNNDFYFLKIHSTTDLNTKYKLEVKYQRNKKKIIKSNLGDNLNPKDIIGELPIVVLSPDFKSITFGTPSDRREFLDKILSQSSKKYITNFLKFKKSLKQRNSILINAKKNHKYDRMQLQIWTDLFIDSSTEIIFYRKKFIDDFSPYFKEYYKLLSNSKEKVEIEYAPNKIDLKSDKDNIKNQLMDLANEYEEQELNRGTTIFGPQKDDINIFVNEGLSKEVASQGQHKTLLISLKFAEFRFLKNIKNETPVILLDDIFSELDYERAENILELLKLNKAQTLITTTNINNIKTSIINGCNTISL